jgi:hypothetical protein
MKGRFIMNRKGNNADSHDEFNQHKKKISDYFVNNLTINIIHQFLTTILSHIFFSFLFFLVSLPLFFSLCVRSLSYLYIRFLVVVKQKTSSI